MYFHKIGQYPNEGKLCYKCNNKFGHIGTQCKRESNTNRLKPGKLDCTKSKSVVVDAGRSSDRTCTLQLNDEVNTYVRCYEKNTTKESTLDNTKATFESSEMKESNKDISAIALATPIAISKILLHVGTNLQRSNLNFSIPIKMTGT